MNPVRWGIVGTGNIATRLAETLTAMPDAELVAVGSRSQASAERFGRAFDIPHRHDSHQALMDNPEVDAVYVATPHSQHCENTLMALEAGKHVLCEKPFAINAAQAKQMIDKAREKKLFLMEAMWTRFLPSYIKLRELLSQGVIGTPELVQCEFGFRLNAPPEHRLLNPDLGGGALLDLGVYPISLAFMVLGRPEQFETDALIGSTGVDEEAEVLLEYSDERRAELAASLRRPMNHNARIYGTDGYIEICSEFWRSQKLIVLAGDKEEHLSLPFEGHGDQFQVQEVHGCIREGRLESETMPLTETLEIMEVMDAIRAHWGLRYPADN